MKNIKNKTKDIVVKQKNINLKPEEHEEKIPKNNSDQYIINNLKKQLLQIKKKQDEKKIRSQAKMENIRKNVLEKITQIKIHTFRNFVQELIPIIDNLQKTIKISYDHNLQNDPIINGLSLTIKSFLDTLQKFDVQMIQSKKNEIYNPKIHEISHSKKSNSTKNNHIVSVIQNGYTINNYVLRKSLVIIAKNDNEKNIYK